MGIILDALVEEHKQFHFNLLVNFMQALNWGQPSKRPGCEVWLTSAALKMVQFFFLLAFAWPYKGLSSVS